MSPFSLFLNELAQACHFKTLNSNQNETCLIQIKGWKNPLLFEFDTQLFSNTVLISYKVGHIPIEYKNEIYEALLKINQNSEETVSVKPDEDVIFIHRRIHPRISRSDLVKVLNRFYGKIIELQKTLTTLVHELQNRDPFSINSAPYKV